MKNKFDKRTDKHPSRQSMVPVKLDGTEREGVIVAHFGAIVEVEDDASMIFRCHLRKNQEPVITGDRVLWHPEKDNTGIVVCGLPRKSLLLRPETSHRNKLIAANIDVIVIVNAPAPHFSEYLLDCYLVAAEAMQVQPIILLNKMDLLDEDSLADIQARLEKYAKIGYEVVYSSIFIPDGLSALNHALKNKVSVLVGPSGVGKSSIIATFTGSKNIVVGDMSAIQQGKHTTTSTRLYHLPEGGGLIDSPGVREFSLWHMSSEQIIKGFIEFQPFLGLCKFRNCRHQTEPGCALQMAVANGDISPERWRSYLDIIE